MTCCTVQTFNLNKLCQRPKDSAQKAVFWREFQTRSAELPTPPSPSPSPSPNPNSQVHNNYDKLWFPAIHVHFCKCTSLYCNGGVFTGMG